MCSSDINQPTDLLCISIDWFLYDGNIYSDELKEKIDKNLFKTGITAWNSFFLESAHLTL